MMTRKNRMIGLIALLIASTASPAFAGGRVSITIVPRGESAEAIRNGLWFYSMARQSPNRTRVDQRGIGNAAGIAQHGRGNWAEIFQSGHNHSATITQNGNNNTFGVFQFGRNAHSDVVQNGDGKVGLVFQGSW